MPGTKHIITSNNSSNYKSVTNVERSSLFFISLVYCLCLWTKWMRKSSSITHCKWPSEHLEVTVCIAVMTHMYETLSCVPELSLYVYSFFSISLVMGSSRNLCEVFPLVARRLVLKNHRKLILTVTIANGLNLSDRVKSTTISLSQQITFALPSYLAGLNC